MAAAVRAVWTSGGVVSGGDASGQGPAASGIQSRTTTRPQPPTAPRWEAATRPALTPGPRQSRGPSPRPPSTAQLSRACRATRARFAPAAASWIPSKPTAVASKAFSSAAILSNRGALPPTRSRREPNRRVPTAQAQQHQPPNRQSAQPEQAARGQAPCSGPRPAAALVTLASPACTTSTAPPVPSTPVTAQRHYSGDPVGGACSACADQVEPDGRLLVSSSCLLRCVIRLGHCG